MRVAAVKPVDPATLLISSLKETSKQFHLFERLRFHRAFPVPAVAAQS